MAGYFAPMDPNDLLAMAWKWQRGDVSRTTGKRRHSQKRPLKKNASAAMNRMRHSA